MGAVPVLNLGTMGTIFGKFLTLFLASLVLGAAAGLFAAIMLKRFNVSSMPQARAAPHGASTRHPGSAIVIQEVACEHTPTP